MSTHRVSGWCAVAHHSFARLHLDERRGYTAATVAGHGDRWVSKVYDHRSGGLIGEDVHKSRAAAFAEADRIIDHHGYGPLDTTA